MSTDLQTTHETQLAQLISSLAGRGADSDWALVRALVHKAVHLAADRRVEYCQLATLLAEMMQHAHSVMHAGAPGHVH